VRALPLCVGLAVAVVSGAIIVERDGVAPAVSASNPSRLAREFGVPGRAWPLSFPALERIGMRFVMNDAGRGFPCIAFSGGGVGGGGCFRAIGEHGGWALEAQVMRTSVGVVLYGVAVPETTMVRAGTEQSVVARVATGPVARRFGVRYFAARVAASAVRVRANDIVALDARQRLLGTQHYNDGQGRFGRRNGRWERRFDRTH
jgi:hypothetical protein